MFVRVFVVVFISLFQFVFVFLSKGWLCVCQPQAGKQWSAVLAGEVINACGS